MALITRPLYLFSCLIILALLIGTVFHLSQLPTVEYPKALLNSILKSGYGGEHRTHNELFSVSTADGKYFMIDFGDQEAFNPNIIPHPMIDDSWIVVAQLRQDSWQFAQISCNAVLENNTLRCVNNATILPIAPTSGDKCTGDLEYVSLNKGPHDARAFYGPQAPYIVFGSNSMFTCFGQWIQDFRMLLEWGYEQFDKGEFVQATELQRPPPWGKMEKNWFLFFDKDDQPYLHYDVAPQRVFAKVDLTGSVGPDLAPLAATHDDICMEKYMPKIGPELESIHQATNSLAITMCRRNDISCTPDDSNTFVFTIFQHKTYFNFHAVYEPYVMLFEQTAPFKVHAISKRPFWIRGRGERTGEDAAAESHVEVPQDVDETKEEMFYVTSVSWKDKAQKYHGYIDDVLFVSFGIEDEKAAAIDVLAEDLLQDLGTC